MAAIDLTTLATAKEWLQMSSITTSDSMISRLITATSTYMQNTLMSRIVAPATYAETRNGSGGDRMMVKNPPIISVASVQVNGVPISPRAPSGNGFTNDEQLVYLTGYVFCRGAQNVALVYDAGFAATPPDLEQACLDILAQWFKNQNRIGKTSESIEGQSISFGVLDVPAMTRNVVNGYRRVSPVY